MDPLVIVGGGVLAPALVAGLIFTIAWGLGGAHKPGRDGRWAGAAALCASVWVGYLLTVGTPASFLPGSNRTPSGLDWTLWGSLLGVPIMAFAGAPGHWTPWLRLLIAGAFIRLVLHGQFQSSWPGREGWQWLAGLAGLFMALWFALDQLAARRSGASSAALLWMLAGGLAILAALTGSAKIGQLGGALAAGFGAAFVLAWRVPRLSLAGSANAMALLLLMGLGLNAYFYSYTPATDILLLASAPFVALLSELPGLRRLTPARKSIVTLGLLGLPIALAIAHAAVEFFAEADEYTGY